jgi:trans-AT polyketide synthase/acyltransferase/oxidoreductase domain-containing protein
MKAIMFPGQGSQYRGMGKFLFSKYRNETELASRILDYDLEELCLQDPQRLLGKTQYTQPALFVVNALNYYDQMNGVLPDYLIGHSLGEYNALHAAGAFDFETGLRLVKKRGELMAAASGGGMAAVIGLDADALKLKLEAGSYNTIDIANYNSPTQVVIAGPEGDIARLAKYLELDGVKVVVLFVTAPFHSRYMKAASEQFSAFLSEFRFSKLTVPVISNATAKRYVDNQVAENLSLQIASPVNWIDTIRLLMGEGVTDYQEIGSGILTKMVNEVQLKCSPILEQRTDSITPKNGFVTSENGYVKGVVSNELPVPSINSISSVSLGSTLFRELYGVKYAYTAGAMYRGVASKELVVLMGKAQMLSFLGTGGLFLEEIEQQIKYIQMHLSAGQPYGMNLLYNLYDKDIEMDTVRMYLDYGVRNVEAAAYMQITLPLVYYRVKGLRRDTGNNIVCEHNIIAKVSRPEVAEAFMHPAPERIVNKLLEQGLITIEESQLAAQVPMSYDICVEADSGGHTDGGVAMVLLPAIQSLRTELKKKLSYADKIRIGLAGGIGTPQAAACAFVMGADFVTTGSINQCTVEAGTSNAVKDLLQEINVQDTDYAPAGDMFEIGAKIQVLKKGTLFSARANKLYALYQRYESLEEIPEKTKQQLEKNYFKKSFEEIWRETEEYLLHKNQEQEILAAQQSSKKKMALVFRWYFSFTSKLSFKGNMDEKVNFQIHTGPALGAFNQWVKGTELERWQNRHADIIAIRMMEEAAILLNNFLTPN